MNHHYAPGFKPSSKKNQKKQSSVTISADIIASRNYTEYVVMKMKESEVQINNESEEPTQVVDLLDICSQNSNSDSQDDDKSVSNLFAFHKDNRKPEPKSIAKDALDSPLTGQWVSKRSSSSSSSSSINPRWCKGKTCKRKAIDDETSLFSTPSNKVNKTSNGSDDEYSTTSNLKVNKQTTLTQYARSLETHVETPVEKKRMYRQP